MISQSHARQQRWAQRAAEEAGLDVPDWCRSSLREQRSAYVAEVDRWLLRLLAGQCHHREFDDIISRENTELCEKLDDTMARFPDPRAYALTRTYCQRAVLDWRRRERVQRCEGAAIEHDELGNRTKGNVVDSFDMLVARPDGDPISLYELVASKADLDNAIEAMVNDDLDRATLVAALRLAARDLLSADERRALEEVVALGRPVVDAAADAGVARETMGRQRDRAIAKLRAAFRVPR